MVEDLREAVRCEIETSLVKLDEARQHFAGTSDVRLAETALRVIERLETEAHELLSRAEPSGFGH